MNFLKKLVDKFLQILAKRSLGLFIFSRDGQVTASINIFYFFIFLFFLFFAWPNNTLFRVHIFTLNKKSLLRCDKKPSKAIEHCKKNIKTYLEHI